MAKFLQETLRESGLKANAHIVGSEAFKEFFRKVFCVFFFTTVTYAYGVRFEQRASCHRLKMFLM